MRKTIVTGLLLMAFLVGATIIYTSGTTYSEVTIEELGVSGGYDPSGNIFFESDHLQVKFDGTTPHVSFFYKDNDTVMHTYYKLMFSWLNETDENGTIVKFYRLEQTTWNHTDVVSIVDSDGNTGLNVNFTSIMKIFANNGFVEVPIKIDVYMYENTKILPFGNTTIEIPAGTFKYSVSIGAWPFESQNNSLEFGVALISNTDAAFYRNIETGEISGNSTDGVQMSINNPDIAIVDDEYVPINTDLKKFGEMTFLTYEFPACNTSLYYDPVIDLSADQSTPSDGTVSQDMVLKGGNTKIIFEGGTPHVKFFFEDENTNFTTFYKIMFSSLNETTPEGNLVNFWRLETAQWNHSDVAELEISNTTVYNVNFTTTMTVLAGTPAVSYEIPMKINVYLFLGNTTIEYLNKTISVTTGTFKYSVEMGAWPFESPNNTLQLNVEIISNVDAMMTYDPETGKLTAESDEGLTMIMNNEEIALIDGEATNISVSYVTSSSKTFISYVFPYFNNSMFYDPTITLEASSDSDSTTTTTTTTSDTTTTTTTDNTTEEETSDTTTTSSTLPGITFLTGFFALLALPLVIIYRRK